MLAVTLVEQTAVLTAEWLDHYWGMMLVGLLERPWVVLKVYMSVGERVDQRVELMEAALAGRKVCQTADKKESKKDERKVAEKAIQAAGDLAA